jgi:formate dehydrogenase iron-sulfur subunit
MSAPNHRDISRRDFLKGVGVGGAALTVAWLLDGRAAPAHASAGPAGSSWGVLIDLTRCTGCNSCALACKESNGLPHPGVVPDALATDAYTFVEERWVTLADSQLRRRYVKRQCMHCLNAACVSACPAAAMHKDAPLAPLPWPGRARVPARAGEGPVIYRASRCLGCRYCQAACPFGVPRFNWDNGVNPVISKCWLCYDRLQADQKPACVEACPAGALRFGRREELLAQAHAQIASNRGRYVDHVFGEFEVGGTAMLYLSDVPFERLGFPADLPATAPPEETAKIISKLPTVLTGMTALMAGTAAYTHRKPAESVQGREEQERVPPPLPADGQEE